MKVFERINFSTSFLQLIWSYSVNHDILLHKLKNLYKIDGTPFKFLTDCLKGRHHRIVIVNKCLTTLAVNSGVPKGSILGLILSVLFVLYAGDTKMWRNIVSPSDRIILQNVIDCLKSWADRNKMKFHPSIC